MRDINKTVASVFFGTFIAVGAFAGELRSYRDKLLGDKLFNDGDYELASKFYGKYMQEASADNKAWLDAAVLTGTAYLRAGRLEEALQLYARISARFPQSNNIRVKLFNAEILTTQKKFADAQSEVENILNEMIAEGDGYYRTLSLLGFILIEQSIWTDAINIYTLLQRAAVGTPWEYQAFCGRVYSLIMNKNYKDAQKLLTVNVNLVNSPGKSEALVLSLLLLEKQKRFKEIPAIFKKIRKNIPDRPDRQMYDILKSVVKYFTPKKDYVNAVYFLHESYLFAENNTERKNILLSLINMYVSTGHNSKAVETCRKYLALFGSSEDVPEMKKQMALLYVKMKKYNEAVNVYTGVMNDASMDMKIRIEAAKSAGNILAGEKDYNNAAKAFSFICKNGMNNSICGEGFMLLGKVYFAQEMFLKAAETFNEAALLSPKHKAVGLYWSFRSYYDLKDYGKALSLIDKLEFEADKELWITQDIAYYRAVIMEKTGKSEKACAEYVKFASLYPETEYGRMALFRAGNIALAEKKFDYAAKIFKDYADRYGKSEAAPAAYYKRVFSLFCAGKSSEASDVVYVLAGKFPKNRYTIAAFFWLVDYYRDRKDYTKADNVLLDIMRRFSFNSDTMSRAMWDRAYIAFKKSDDKGAVVLLEKLLKDYPKATELSHAYYLLGDIYSDRGKYKKAVGFYEKCLKHKPDYEIENACRGRLGDCYVSSNSLDRDPKLIDKAITEYLYLLGRDLGSATVRNQTLYKLGKCYEIKKETQKALERFKEIIYGYKVDSERKIYVKPLWVVKAAHAAIDIYMDEETRAGDMSAVKIYRILQSMNLKTGENYDKIIKKIKDKHKL